ncbi:MAG: hypothetical protein ACRC92_26640 [Peptostreptococcaceae bacterium]
MNKSSQIREFEVNFPRDINIKSNMRTTKTETVFDEVTGESTEVEVEYEIDIHITKGGKTETYLFEKNVFKCNPFTDSIYYKGKPMFPFINKPMSEDKLIPLERLLFISYLSGVKDRGGELSNKMALASAYDETPLGFIRDITTQQEVQEYMVDVPINGTKTYNITKDLLTGQTLVRLTPNRVFKNVEIFMLNTVTLNTSYIQDNNFVARVGVNKFEDSYVVRDITSGSTMVFSKEKYDKENIPLLKSDVFIDVI